MHGTRGCRLEIMTDHDPSKSYLELLFIKSFIADISFISMLFEENLKIFATMKHFKNQRQPVLLMTMKHQGCPI